MQTGTATLLALSLWWVPFTAPAQEGGRVHLDPDDGLVVEQDSTFRLEFHFRMQDRVTYRHTAGAGKSTDDVGFMVRRFRLKFDGFVLSPRLGYKLQLGLSERDMTIGDEASMPSPLLDALVLYRLADNTQVGFGQGKLPGGRQALVSSGEMELPERPVANSAFTMDRDIGFFAWQQLPMGAQRLHVMAAITQGEGRAAGHPNAGLCYTGRVEWLPFGAFSADGEYVEGDLVREPAPKLALAVAYSGNDRAQRARAPLGPRLPGGLGRTTGTFFADAIVKLKGWSWQSEFNRRLVDGDPWATDTITQESIAVNEGWGLSSQVSCMLGECSQVVLRWSTVRPDDAVHLAYTGRDETMLGFNHYLHMHRIKLQAALFHEWGPEGPGPDLPGNAFGAMFQVELGI
ncbi:MAG: hypothetical protein KDB93_06870 [Flavobacteriales bacterium]|nr:hypothetical protein [Flavobacteriales bacterium]